MPPGQPKEDKMDVREVYEIGFAAGLKAKLPKVAKVGERDEKGYVLSDLYAARLDHAARTFEFGWRNGARVARSHGVSELARPTFSCGYVDALKRRLKDISDEAYEPKE
jgi:hypothetical protein